MKEITTGVELRQHKALNNPPDSSHLPTQRREGVMQRFKSSKQTQQFLAVHEPVANLLQL